MKRIHRFFWLPLLVFAMPVVLCAQQVHVRVTLLEPANAPYKVQVVVRPSYSTNTVFFAGKTLSSIAGDRYTLPPADVLQARENEVAPADAGQATPWMDLTGYLESHGLATIQFLFVPAASFTNTGVRARFDVATAADDKAIVRSITDHDPGNVISLRVPRDLAKDKAWLLSIREDSERRLKEIQGFGLPAGPLPKKIWLMTGFRPWGMHTDPTITESDFQVIHALGMNGYWDFTPETWKLAPQFGIDRTTVYWRAPGSPPGFNTPEGIRLDWDKLGKWIDDAYQRDVAATRKLFGGTIPPAIADLMDEPAGVAFKGPEYDVEFAKFLQERGLTPDLFGKKTWDEVKAVRTQSAYFWWDYYQTRKDLDLSTVEARRLFYWSSYFLTVANTKLFTLGTQAVEKYAPEIIATRVNIGPPWWYDYGTIPRGMDNFDMGRLRGITMPFNEDWIGNGNPRWPLESNTLLADWDRAPFRPRSPVGGGYLTRDANRTAVKLRVFGFLARDCKIFDFYYYGPAYGHFDHWSDNASMVQGVAEVTRDIGRADNMLWEGHPPAAEVALLFPRSWPVWQEDATELIEFEMVYIALLHAGIPVDIISDDQVEAGGLEAGKYKCLYVVNESVPAKTAATIEHWVKKGGRLWAEGWAGMRDEYNTPTTAWNEMLGVSNRSWKAVGDLKRYGELIKYADERRPYFSRVCDLEITDKEVNAKIRILAGAQFPGRPAGALNPYYHNFGQGGVAVIPWTAGKTYIDGAERKDGAIAEGAILYLSDGRRQVIAGYAREAVRPPAETSVSQILAWPLWSKKQGVVLLANFTGNPADAVKVTFAAPVRVRTLQSLRAGKLKFQRVKDGRIECTLPVRDVTDMLIVNE